MDILAKNLCWNEMQFCKEISLKLAWWIRESWETKIAENVTGKVKFTYNIFHIKHIIYPRLTDVELEGNFNW